MVVGEKVVDPNLDAFLSSGRDSLTYIGITPFDNKRKIIVFQRTHEFPYMVAVASNVESELVGWYQKKNYLLLWLVIKYDNFVPVNSCTHPAVLGKK